MRGIPWTLGLLLAAPAATAQTMTTKKALELAFPGCEVERRELRLGKAQRAAIAKISGQPCKASVVFAYIARKKDRVVGTAWFDVHKVRSKKQLLMVAITPAHTVHRVEVLAFREPRRYASSRKWLDKMNGHARVRPGREAPRITGATLTVRATTRCVTRMLARQAVLFPKPVEPAPKPNGKKGEQ